MNLPSIPVGVARFSADRACPPACSYALSGRVDTLRCDSASARGSRATQQTNETLFDVPPRRPLSRLASDGQAHRDPSPDGFDASDPDASCVYFDQLTMSRIDFDEYYSPAGIVVDRLGGPRAPAADEGEL